MKWLLGILIAAVVLVAGYTWLMLHWNYSTGERAGYVQKLSRKGWVCKTWEGEMALVSLPGTVSEKFAFSVRDDAVAEQINQSVGSRVDADLRAAHRGAHHLFRRDAVLHHRRGPGRGSPLRSAEAAWPR